MTHKKFISLAYSPCPNDTYIFHGLAHNLVNTDNIEFNITLADVESLNQSAANKEFDVTKLSFAAFGALRDKYALLKTGAALGRGCGPLVISMPKKNLSKLSNPVIAIPGLGTTAYLLFRFYLKDLYPDLIPEIIPMPFEKVMPAVIKGEVDFGIIIHEGRFVYEKSGLDCLVDLGQWWEDKTALPIPLGCIAIKRDIDNVTASKIENLIAKSIEYAAKNPMAGTEYIKKHARELADNVINEHINLYVNDFSKNLGKQGQNAVEFFFKKAEDTGLIPKSSKSLFACRKQETSQTSKVQT